MSATWTTSVAASDDDALQTGGGTAVELTNATLTVLASTAMIGLRFLNCQVPPKAKILQTYVTAYLTSGSFDDPRVTIRAQLGDAAAFVDVPNNMNDRTKTTASVDWIDSGLGVGLENTPDLTTVIQEMVNDASYALGNDVAIFMVGIDSSSNIRIASWDNASLQEPSITIIYSISSPPRRRGGRTYVRM